MKGIKIRVRGVVQGVGFRPFIANLAESFQLNGEVWNDAQGVGIQVWGDDATLQQFVQDVTSKAPPLAKVQHVSTTTLTKTCEVQGFKILASVDGNTSTGVAADAATCVACLQDVNNPADRHYQYPFTNCTHCGPRLSIIREVPYDRKNTSMASFEMCTACQKEYENHKNRRFHAQPNACPDCGPQLQFLDAEGKVVVAGNNIEAAAAWIKQGKIVAVKGLGGIHLACDASNEEVVNILRQRKCRFGKPFAMMAKDEMQVRQYADVSQEEALLLQGVEAPVVVLNAKPNYAIAPSVAPGQSTLGFMLPYTPLHHLLLAIIDNPIVLTSGNVSEEPQCIDNNDAMGRLSSIADGFLLHNRDIVNRLDDSVIKVMAAKPRLMRRARGFSPSALLLPKGFENAHGILAMGGELKNTFCLLQHGHAIMSQHMGDLENTAVHSDYQKNLTLYQKLYDFEPVHISVDKHPDYFSTQWGKHYASTKGLEVSEVQHHHAHIAACMAECGLPLGSEVLGIALDGLGMGEHGELWGGEFLHVSYQSSYRVSSIQTAALLGGAKAMYEPWRNTFAQLNALGWDNVIEKYADLPLIQKLSKKPVHNLQVMCDKGLNSPQASSMGRLFDAVAAALDICFERAAFEGQAAMALEVLASKESSSSVEPYPVGEIKQDGLIRLSWSFMWAAILHDLEAGVAKPEIAMRFHQTVIHAVSQRATFLLKKKQLSIVVLSGGVFQNKILLEGVFHRLDEDGFQVMIPQNYPLNDGGLSLGQAVIAAANM